MNENTLPLRTLTDVLNDYHQLLNDKLPLVKPLIRGRQFIIESKTKEFGRDSHVAERWICYAHQGTIEKLERLFPIGVRVSDFEVVAVSRNLFENLVWCRLFKSEIHYGLVFYEQLLREQIESLEAHVRKIDSEISLFGELEALEEVEIASLSERFKGGEIDDAQFKDAFQTMKSDVDEKARGAFAIYGAAAVYNGYGYQKHLLANSIKPKLEADRDKIQSELDALEAVEPDLRKALLSEVGTGRRLNWRKAAAKIGMRDEYDFLYSFASKMLHSKAMSMVPNGHLSEQEAILMFEYAIVAATGILECMGSGALSTVPDLSILDLEAD